MVAPFWADVDTRDDVLPDTSGIVYYKLTPTSLIVKWNHVGYYGVHADLVNTFQLIITDGTDPLLPGGNRRCSLLKSGPTSPPVWYGSLH